MEGVHGDGETGQPVGRAENDVGGVVHAAVQARHHHQDRHRDEHRDQEYPQQLVAYPPRDATAIPT